MNIKGIIQFDSNDKIYNDHFPGNPIVPGSLIINSLLQILLSKPKKCDNRNYTPCNFRFKSFVTPGKDYFYTIDLVESKAVCKLYDETNVYTTGIFKNEDII